MDSSSPPRNDDAPSQPYLLTYPPLEQAQPQTPSLGHNVSPRTGKGRLSVSPEAAPTLRRSPRFRRDSEGLGLTRDDALTLRRSPRLRSAPPWPELVRSKTPKGAGRSLPLRKGKNGLHGFNTGSSVDLLKRSTRQFLASLGIQNSFSSTCSQISPNPIPKSHENGQGKSVPSGLLNPQLEESRKLESELLFLTWHGDDDRDSLRARCCDSSVSPEKYIGMSSSLDERPSKRVKNISINLDNKVLDEVFRQSASDAFNAEESRESEADLLLLTWHGDNDRNSLHARHCDSSVSQEKHIRMSSSPDEQPSKRVNSISPNPDQKVLDEKFFRQSAADTNPCLSAENGKIIPFRTESPESIQKGGSPKNLRSLQWKTSPSSSEKKQKKHKTICSLTGDPIPSDEAEERWHWRYELKRQRSSCQRRIVDDDDEDKIVWNVESHYTQADIEGTIFKLGDCVYVKGEGSEKHIGRIIEFFRTTEGEDYFRVQWFYKAEDTIMKEQAASHDKHRVFYSTVMNDNPVDCIISKVTVTQVPPVRIGSQLRSIRQSDFYFDMEYCVDYSTFRTLPTDSSSKRSELYSSNSADSVPGAASNASVANASGCGVYKAQLALLDLFSGCGGMSTGLCLGARLSCVDLVTRWALDSDQSACESLKLNHPETQVRNEAADDFLELLKEWKKLCTRYADDIKKMQPSRLRSSRKPNENGNCLNGDDAIDSNEFEVSRLLDICYGDPEKTGKRGLKFKVRWKGYDSSEDTWEPIEGLSNCQECIREFVREGYTSKILPLPGDVDVICGGPPCQGISGYNRFRNVNSPLDDERNRQIVVFMDIVQFLKPKYVLMENVLDILRFNKGCLGRYALSRLVLMKYQARLGIMAAGCYGLPQFRLRVFLWGALPGEKLPQFPLPTHDVIVKYWPPSEFERNTVAYDEEQPREELEKAAVLWDAISDLPSVTCHENQEEMAYQNSPETEFQAYIRSTKVEMTGSELSDMPSMNEVLFDHRTYSLTEEDYARVCRIPKRKGANFRDLPGVVVGGDNVARRDPAMEQLMLPSGKPLVPDFALTYEQGKSKRPYARLWWDETVSTIVTYPDLHCQAVIHPEQDRVLTLRECARLQGFPDHYRFCGTVKERYRQVGNAVAVPVARALGYSLGMAFQKLGGDEPLLKLPPKFAHSNNLELAKSLFEQVDEN